MMIVCSNCKIAKKERDFEEKKKQCNQCKSEKYYTRTYQTKCSNCTKNRPIDNNLNCKNCNNIKGLRQCRLCSHVLPIAMSYYEGKHEPYCKDCQKEVRKIKRLLEMKKGV